MSQGLHGTFQEEAVAGMQVKESGSHLLFGELVVQGERRKLGPLAEDTRVSRSPASVRRRQGAILLRTVTIH